MHRIIITILIVSLFGCSQKDDVPVTLSLHQGWEFRKAGDSMWHSATVPGNIFSDLLHHELIPDPFIMDNESKVQWVSETDWEYKTTLVVDKKTLQKKHIMLNFEGLDTYASVYLNDSLILQTNNAFRSFVVDVKSLVKVNNELRILFERSSKYEEEAKAKLHYTLPEGNRIFSRKAQFQYGWDWGPTLNTSGIWRSITLSAWNDNKINNVYAEQLELTDSVAKLKVHLETIKEPKEEAIYEIYVNDSLTTSSSTIRNQKSEINFNIRNPKRWWPHNLGNPYLYDIKVVVKEGNTILDSISKKIGLRTIDLVTEKDSIGESFYFKVNDVPVYAKGANYIPQNSMQNKVSDEHYKKLLSDVVEANMNMLRVWGGGIYENDIFYDLCDEKGILVWQDFMFACAMYPGDDEFLENVQQEAIDNITRLRNHASIALWCGNNENSEGWHRWGWQEGRKDVEKNEIWNNYLKVFDSILPYTVSSLTNTEYWESSPKYGRGNPKYEYEGDAHDWWVWHDGYPFEHFQEHVPRFMSEFGFQSFPSYEVINYINQNDSVNIGTKGFENHQKHHRGFELIQEYMARDFPVPENSEDYVYMSQVLQAYGITKGIEAHRRSKPRNMGTLYWQLNDCWPAVSWSSIDFLGNWKALHYKAKKTYENVFISSVVEGDMLKSVMVNDSLKSISLNLNFELIDFNGHQIWSETVNAVAEANSADQIFQVNLDTINFDKNSVVLKISTSDKQWLHYFTKPKDLKLLQGEIKKSITRSADGLIIELTSDTLQKDVYLFSDSKGHFSDNFFDLLPNTTKKVLFRTKNGDTARIRSKCVNTFIR